jgi:hypothetical protein
VANAGHTVTVLSLSQDEFDADLGRIPVAYIADAIRAIEVREASAIVAVPGPLSERSEATSERRRTDDAPQPARTAAPAPPGEHDLFRRPDNRGQP